MKEIKRLKNITLVDFDSAIYSYKDKVKHSIVDTINNNKQVYITIEDFNKGDTNSIKMENVVGVVERAEMKDHKIVGDIILFETTRLDNAKIIKSIENKSMKLALSMIGNVENIDGVATITDGYIRSFNLVPSKKTKAERILEELGFTKQETDYYILYKKPSKNYLGEPYNEVLWFTQNDNNTVDVLYYHTYEGGICGRIASTIHEQLLEAITLRIKEIKGRAEEL